MHDPIAQSSHTKKLKCGIKHTCRKPWMTEEMHNLILKRRKLDKSTHDRPYNKLLYQKYLHIKNLVADIINIARKRILQE